MREVYASAQFQRYLSDPTHLVLPVVVHLRADSVCDHCLACRNSMLSVAGVLLGQVREVRVMRVAPTVCH